MIKILCKICCFFVISNLILACNTDKTTPTHLAVDKFVPHFPDDWMGCWKGNLKIYGHEGVKQEVPMAIEHGKTDKTDEFSWALFYGEDKEKGKRDYYLKVEDLEKGHFLLDEKNDIFLDTYLIGNKMISDYTVEGNQITSVYTLEQSKMIFEIFFSVESGKRESGDSVINKDTIPGVISFPVKAYQRAVLHKKLPCHD